MVNIHFLPDMKDISVKEGCTILEAVHSADVHIMASCGGEQLCGECKVRIISETPQPVDIEESYFTSEELRECWRLACCHEAAEGMKVIIPDENRIEIEKVIDSSLTSHLTLNPLVEKAAVTIEPGGMKEKEAIDSYIGALIQDNGCRLEMPLYVRQCLSSLPDNAIKTLTIVHNTNQIIDVEDGDTTERMYGLALDIGTTTIAGLLIDLHTGDTAGIETRVNSQADFGADVMSRINFIVQDNNGLQILTGSVRKTINEIIEALIDKAKVPRKFIYHCTVVGNTTMLQLFQGISPQQLAHTPYLPVSRLAHTIPAKDLELNINSHGMVYIFPVLSGFVGGDTVGVILAAGLDKSEKLRVAIDLGTNGEIAAGSSERLIAAATAAGPAFEGAGITCGMPATRGAINSFHIDDDNDCLFTVIGSVSPQGICGSGIIDIIAELLRFGIINESGRLIDKKNLKGKIPDKVLERIISDGNTHSFLLWEGDEKRIVLTQQDVREFQLAKGAIRTGITILTKTLNIADSDIDEILIAGTFGTYVRKESIQRIGLLPPVPISKINIIGNAACLGSKRVLINKNEAKQAEFIAKTVESENLAMRTDFQEEFMMAVSFPPQESVQL